MKNGITNATGWILDGGIVTVDDKGELEESFDNNVVKTKKDGELDGGTIMFKSEEMVKRGIMV